MEDLKKEINRFKETNTLTDLECAKALEISPECFQDIQEGKANLEKDQVDKILNIIKSKKKSSGKKVVRILDLLFRCGSTIMALVVLLLCINGYSETHTLIALLSISVVCSSMTILPKIEK